MIRSGVCATQIIGPVTFDAYFTIFAGDGELDVWAKKQTQIPHCIIDFLQIITTDYVLDSQAEMMKTTKQEGRERRREEGKILLGGKNRKWKKKKKRKNMKKKFVQHHVGNHVRLRIDQTGQWQVYDIKSFQDKLGIEKFIPLQP